MIRQSELKKYLELKDQVKTFEKSLKERLKAGEKIQPGMLVVSIDSVTSWSPSWKEITVDSGRIFKSRNMFDALAVMEESYDKLSQPHQTQPSLRVENKAQKKARIEKSNTPNREKESKKLGDYL